jgi:hypothetical protein
MTFEGIAFDGASQNALYDDGTAVKEFPVTLCTYDSDTDTFSAAQTLPFDYTCFVKAAHVDCDASAPQRC